MARKYKVDTYSNDYGWTTDTFKNDFEGFEHDGIESPNAGERAILFNWMYVYIDENFFDWSCKLLKELREQNKREVSEKGNGAFVYQGYVFVPHRKLEGIEKSLAYLNNHIEFDYLTEYLEPDWSHNGFYEASNDSECDLFWCDGMLWIPRTNYMFKWTGKK